MVNSWRKHMRSLFVLTFLSLFIFPASSNYQLKGYKLGGASGTSDSTNNSLYGVVGEGDEGVGSSSNYDLNAGDIYPIQANVPSAPTFVNSDSWYNKLHFTINVSNNPSDTTFAIAITDDNWATTRYVQSDNTIGDTLGTEDYQTYANWGGSSGEYITGLAPDTTYKIKVKAMHGDFTESPYGPEATAATVSPSITASIGGISSGSSLEGITTDVTTTSSSVSFGELPFNTRQEAANSITVTTNAVSGYQVSVRQESAMASSSDQIDSVSGTNASPSAWPSTTILRSAYGYHTSDEVLKTGNVNRFVSDDTFAAFDTTAYEVAYNPGPVTSGEQTNVVYAIEVGKAQSAGVYTHTITYTIYGVF